MFQIRFLLIGLFCLSLSFVSCETNTHYINYQEIKNMKWGKDSLLTFKPTIQEKLEVVDIYLNVRHTGMYSFSNLFIFLNIDLPNGKSRTDTIECVLANKRGLWLGNGIGDLFDYKKPIIRIAEPDTGTYRLSIQHGMRVNKLYEISSIGISIEKPLKFTPKEEE